jgi:ADP-ribosylglycohydrolase
VLGAIAGDIIGSRFEGSRRPPVNFRLFAKKSRFTDDTTLTVAVAQALMGNGDFTESIRDYYFYYPRAGYGSSFHAWARSESDEPYNSWGNGSAMRVSPVVWIARDGMGVLELAKATADVTHNHPEGVRGAQAIAGLAWLARAGESKESIAEAAVDEFGYDYKSAKEEPCILECSCANTVPKAIHAFIYSQSFEDAIRRGIRMGGDADTIAAMAGTIAEHYYGIPDRIKKGVFERLDKRLGEATVNFYRKFVDPNFDPLVEFPYPEEEISLEDEKLEDLLAGLFST